ncbi:hypothetical protein DMH25_08100 [Streptomyces sp. WAC 01325]|uniref:hypothetical protein n=1 Tax=Streptomyces sp. WAC 01325 TaxID=2203202 RepID=UPI000F89717D|nr:hypothetical protein [Streptomyces sp. WAC 01325]RSN13743.1 hypothetical protein DMH25_08100 [Streptomyces sp. WAC 01325]
MSFDLGAVVPLGTTVRDANGSLANAGAMALTITLPDNTAVTVSPVVPTSTGTYTHDYPSVQAGRHIVRWVATGINAGAYTDVFDVREAAPPLLFSLASAKAKLDIPATSTSQDEELREFIEATTQCVEYFVGAVVRRTVQQVVSGGRDALLLHTTPVLAVSAVTPVQTGQETVDVGILDLDVDTGIVRRTDGLCFPVGPYRVLYTAGRTAVRPNISLAAKLILQHLWRTNYGAARGLAGIGGGEDFAVTEPIPGLGYAIPNRALQLLEGDRQPGGFA